MARPVTPPLTPHTHDANYTKLVVPYPVALSDAANRQYVQDVASTRSPINHNHDATYAALSHTQEASTITDFDIEVSNNVDVADNTAARHTHVNAAVLDATTASFLIADETKLDGIAAGAEVNVNADWSAASGDAQILNKPTIPTTANAVLSANRTTTVTTAADVTDMAFAIPASQTWTAEFNLQHGCDNTGGVKYAISVPVGATFRAVVEGNETSTSRGMAVLVVSDTLSAQAFNIVNTASGYAKVTLGIVNGATAGTVQLRFASGVDTQTSTVYANSYLTARKI